ncbi:MAG TPA: hypothetical protein VGK02_00495 [Candidatus Aquicultor sp.]|jgi:hypothetical protein
MDSKALEQLVLKYLTAPFLKSVTEAVYLARRDGWEESRQAFEETEAENIRGFYTRAKLEGLLRDVADRYGLQSEVKKAPKQPWNHTEITSGPVTLTAATVSAPCAMVDACDYRRGLARTAQGQLFNPDPPYVIPSEDDPDRCYVILTHSRYRGLRDDYRENGHLPGSIYLVWPAADFDCYVHDINLMEAYPDIARRYVPKHWDEEAILEYLRKSKKGIV